MSRPQVAGRLNAYHGPKKNVLGNNAGRAAPAWRANNMSADTKPVAVQNGATFKFANGSEAGSKAMLTNLPHDVREAEIEDLMRKTIGPVKETFIIYNSQGLTKGMAVVAFHRTADATRAKEKYDGKVIDGRRALKIEIIIDSDIAVKPGVASQPPKPKSLFDRLGVSNPKAQGVTPVIGVANSRVKRLRYPHEVVAPKAKVFTVQPVPQVVPVHVVPVSARRVRQKKGPRRVRKPATREQLDQEMDTYRAAAVVEGEMDGGAA